MKNPDGTIEEERMGDIKRTILTPQEHAARALDRDFGEEGFAKTPPEEFGGGEEFRNTLKETRDRLGLITVEPKEEEPRVISFSDAVTKLKGTLDLEQTRERAVRDHFRWGLVQALIKKGVVKSEDQYGALFDGCRFTEGGLGQVGKGGYLPILTPGGLTPKEAFGTLVVEPGIPHWQDSYALQNLNDLRQIDPNKISGLHRLHKQTPEEQRKIWMEILQSSPVVQPGSPTISFTPDNMEVTDTGKSAVQHVQAHSYEGTRHMDPFSDFLRWRTQVDRGLATLLEQNGISLDGLSPEDYQRYLRQSFDNETIDPYLPDRERITQYPLHGLRNGGVLDFSWDPTDRKVDLNCYDPVNEYDGLGSRVALQ